MTSNVVISEVDALMYFVLSKAKKHMPYEELVGTTKCVTLYPRCCLNRSRYNRVKLCVCVCVCVYIHIYT